MSLFDNFSAPLREIFIGNILMLITIIFYIAWWTASFRSGDSQTSGGILIAITLVAGLSSLVLISLGMMTGAGRGFPVIMIFFGAVAFYIILLQITRAYFHRPVTAELLIIVIWAAMELSAMATVYDAGRFGLSKALTLAALVMLATVAGMVCYIIYYRLDESMRLVTGLIPLIADGMVVAVFLVMMAVR